jgi:hypothetical protein
MLKIFSYLILSFCLCSLAYAKENSTQPEIIKTENSAIKAEETVTAVSENIATPTAEKPELKNDEPKVAFQPFTGKIEGNKVRLRVHPDLESKIVRQFKKNDLALVVGEKENFWAVQVPTNLKVYAFRSYILDNTVEADRVNIRLEPNLDSPIVGQLHKGDKVQGEISSIDNKWLEMTPPQNVQFYISKEYLTKVGDENYFSFMETRKSEVEKLLNSAYFITQAECKKGFDEMNPEEAIKQFDTIIKGYSDFPDHVQQAKEGLSLLQDNYLQKKIAYLESKSEKDSSLASTENALPEDKKDLPVLKKDSDKKNITDKMRFWNSIEESLYLTWTTFHPEKNKNDFYNEQKVNSITLSGVIESYNHTVKDKPGDFLIKGDNVTAYIYSTAINLEDYVGKNITIIASPRPNNNFAFPAYFVNEIE